MSKGNIIILGGNPTNIGVVKNIYNQGYQVIVVDFREKITLLCDQHIVFDAKDPTIGKHLKKLDITNIKGVFTSMDNAGLAQREICKEYGLLHASQEAIMNARHKNKMHAKWQEHNLLNRISFTQEIYDLKQIQTLNKQYKIIIKPTDAWASSGITILEKNTSDNILEKAFINAKEKSTNGFVNIEEFVEGTEYTAELIGDNYGNIAVFSISKKYHTQNSDANSIAIKLHYNALDIPNQLQNKIANYAIQCYEVLGLKNTLGHMELIIKTDGTISPVEIGARSSGFIASPLVDIASGQNYLKTFIGVLNGEEVSHGLIPQSEKSSMYFFYDLPANHSAKNTVNFSEYLPKEIKSIYFDRDRLIKGTLYTKLEKDTDRYGYEVLEGTRQILTIENINNIEEKFLKALLYE